MDRASARISATRRRFAVVAAVVAVVAMGGAVGVARIVAAAPAPEPVGDSAEADGTAQRGERTQIDPLGPAPSYGGCVKPGVATVTAGAPGRTWQLATVNGKWRIGFRAQAGQRGAVVVVGDSLTYLGIAETMSSLVSAGYGPICVDAGYGRFVTIGTGTSSVSSGLDVIRRVRASAPVWQMDTVRWVIALGTNDVGQVTAGDAPVWCVQQIAAARWAIGFTSVAPEWVNVRTRRVLTQYAENVWNGALTTNGFAAIDWSAAVLPWPELYIREDLVHPTTYGIELRARLVVG